MFFWGNKFLLNYKENTMDSCSACPSFCLAGFDGLARILSIIELRRETSKCLYASSNDILILLLLLHRP